MNVDSSVIHDFVRRAMVARIATLSSSGRPSITPLYFVYVNGHIWLGTADWTLAARAVKADPHVSIFFEVERTPNDSRILRIRGCASVQRDWKTLRSSDLLSVCEYILT